MINVNCYRYEESHGNHVCPYEIHLKPFTATIYTSASTMISDIETSNLLIRIISF